MNDFSYNRFFKTLGNPKRLAIIHYLAKRGPRSVSDIVQGTSLEQTAVSHDLQRLLSCQFVHIKRSGKERLYSINEQTIKPLLELLDNHVNTYCKNVCELCEDHMFARQRVHHSRAVA